jgi:myo-inositol-1(or 4)-monophosphatase
MSDSPAAGTDAASSGSAPSVGRWLTACRAAVEGQKRVFSEHVGIEARTHYDGVGEGGDNTLVIDRLCEDVFFDQLDLLAAEGYSFTAISEERGVVRFGEDTSADQTIVVIDPIDGSLNARRTIPCHSLSVAVSTGMSMAEVTFGYVYEFGAAEEFYADRGSGAVLDGRAVRIDGSLGDGLEIVGMEATRPERMVRVADEMTDRVFRLRTPGSLAVSLVYVAAGRFDGMLSMRGCRSVDAAAGQLIVREAGAHLSFAGEPLEKASLDLGARYHVAAARTVSDLDFLLSAQALLE